MTSENGVFYRTSGNIGSIVLGGRRHNPLDLETLNSLISAFEQSETNADLCVLFTANGDNFTVGADLKYVQKLVASSNFDEFEQFSAAFQDLTKMMVSHSGVIVTGLHGWVIGGGFEICLSADLRYATRNTRIKLPELSIGTMFSNASTKLLPQIIGMGRAKELMFLGREIDANEAFGMGLINGLVDSADDLTNKLHNVANQMVEHTDRKALATAKELITTNQELGVTETLDTELQALKAFGKNELFLRTVRQFGKEVDKN